MPLQSCACLCASFSTNSTSSAFYTLSLHDALPIFRLLGDDAVYASTADGDDTWQRTQAYLPGLGALPGVVAVRSEEHTSELQSLRHLVYRLLLEQKKSVPSQAQ